MFVANASQTLDGIKLMLVYFGWSRFAPPSDNTHVLQLGLVQLGSCLAVHTIRQHHSPALQFAPIFQSDLSPCARSALRVSECTENSAATTLNKRVPGRKSTTVG